MQANKQTRVTEKLLKTVSQFKVLEVVFFIKKGNSSNMQKQSFRRRLLSLFKDISTQWELKLYYV